MMYGECISPPENRRQITVLVGPLNGRRRSTTASNEHLIYTTKGGGRGRPVLPAAQRGALCPVDHPYRGPLLLITTDLQGGVLKLI
eukprot:1189070-Prorocentrum_minimum.AAC.1